MYNDRGIYRKFIRAADLTSFGVTIKETDLYILADRNLVKEAYEITARVRKDLENFIQKDPLFRKSFSPYKIIDSAPPIALEMMAAGHRAKVGPMAAVAGAIAEYVGLDLLKYSCNVIIENGGDIFLSSLQVRRVSIFAGGSPLSGQLALVIEPEETPLGICTSSGTVGPSFSYGKADAVTILSPSTALADAAATAIGNVVKTEEDIPQALELAKKIDGVKGVVIIKGKKVGAWGHVQLRPI